VSNVVAAIGLAVHWRRRLCWVLAWLAVISGGATVLAFDVYRFLYGDVTVLALGVAPTGLVVSPDGRTVYVANSSDGITPVSAATGKAGKAIVISGGAPGGFIGGPVGGLAITPDGRTLFTTVYDEESGASLPLARVDLRTGQETGQVQVPGGVVAFVLSGDGKTLYLASGDNQLYAVSAVTSRPERHIPAPQGALEDAGAMVLSPDGRTLYTAVPGLVDGSGRGAAVVPVSLQTGAAGRAVSVGWRPAWLAVTPDGRTLYAAVDGMDAFGQSFPNRIVAIDTAAGRVRASIPWKVPPQQLAMAPDGATVWVMSVTGDRKSTADDTVTPLSVASGRPGSSFRTAGLLNSGQNAPAGVTLSPDGRRVYVAVSAGLETFSASLQTSCRERQGVALTAGSGAKAREAAMRLRPHRRNLVVFSSPAEPATRRIALQYSHPARTGRIRRLIRIGALLAVITVRPRWQPLLAGTALTVLGLVEWQGVGGVFIVPGLLMLWCALLTPGDTGADYERRCRLKRELAAFSTPSQRCDLEATLDRYPDGITYEMRNILSGQAVASHNNRIPGAGRQ
jgi:DNA-binding beta-propeller fold protein YncE